MLNAEQLQQIKSYQSIMATWNRHHNLTRLSNQEDFNKKHLDDTSLIFPHIITKRPQSVVDLGTGNGIPGMILAIAFPTIHWHLVDARRKKTLFLKEVSHELGLDNVDVHHQRIEKLTLRVDLGISRAVSCPLTLLSLSEKLQQGDFSLWLMRAKPWQAELPTPWLGEETRLAARNSERYLLKLHRYTGQPDENSLE